MRRVSNAVALSALISSEQQCRGLTTYSPKADIPMGRFEFAREYDEFRNRSGRAPDYLTKEHRDTYWRLDEYVRRAEAHLQNQAYFYLPTLEFPWYKGCMPLFSSYQIRVHYSRHHRAYVEKLNKLIEGTKLYGRDLDEIIRISAEDPDLKGVLNNAAQHYNHCFFWKSIQPHGSNCPPDLKAAIESQYGSVKDLEKKFTDAALNLFGSGWVYLVYDTTAQKFDILSYSNAGCPLTSNEVVPMLCADVWEHTYYIDYENDRAAYLSKYFACVDWHWAERHWKRATGQPYHEMKWY